MDMDILALGSGTVTQKRRIDTSSQNNDTLKVKSRNEEALKQQQEARETATKQLEIELQKNEQQKERIDAEKYLKEIIDITEIFNRKLKFSIDKDLDQVIVKVVDAETDKVIKEIPPEELKRLYAKMKEAIGLIIDKTI